ncbi:MAG: FmdB family zinc ribbon protein [Thermodesulfobacteriota bacterium]
MPIYEYRCEDCGRVSEFLLIRTDEAFTPQCKRCKSKKMSRILSRVRLIRSEESRLESLADPMKWSGLDEKDPKSMAKWMRQMGKELGEDMDEDLDRAIEEEISSESEEDLED